MPHAIRSKPRRFIVLFTSFGTLALGGCSEDDEGAACSWLFGPTSFVDAGEPGCAAEPAGNLCDPSTGRCHEVCPPGEYLLTCTRHDVPRSAIPEETLDSPVVVSGERVVCNAVPKDALAGERSAYCCQCDRR
jgi:hypothetical protein